MRSTSADTLFADFFKERRQRVIVEPLARLGCLRHGRKLRRALRRGQVAEGVLLAGFGPPAAVDLKSEQSLVDHVAEPVDHARPVEIEPDGRRDIQRVEAGAVDKRWLRLGERMAAKRLEQRMAGRDPFEVVLVRRLAVGGEARITVGQRLKLPVRLVFVASEGLRASSPGQKCAAARPPA